MEEKNGQKNARSIDVEQKNRVEIEEKKGQKNARSIDISDDTGMSRHVHP